MYTEKAEQKLTSTLLNSFLCFLFVVVKLLCFLVQKHICCMVIYVWTIPNEAFSMDTNYIYLLFFFQNHYIMVLLSTLHFLCVWESPGGSGHHWCMRSHWGKEMKRLICTKKFCTSKQQRQSFTLSLLLNDCNNIPEDFGTNLFTSTITKMCIRLFQESTGKYNYFLMSSHQMVLLFFLTKYFLRLTS